MGAFAEQLTSLFECRSLVENNLLILSAMQRLHLQVDAE